ncbi:hypothetical protein N9D38_11445 [Rubripirellula sp.]|nr:hypothetical protein [Rubripirellula sp.]
MIINNKQLEKQLFQAVLSEIRKRVRKNKNNVQRRLENAIRNWVMDSDTIQSLMENKHFSLKAKFGLTDVDAQQAVNDLTIAIGRCLRAEIRDSAKSIEVEFSFVRSDFSDLLSLSSSSFMTEKGKDIPWLNWLLTQGDRVVVADYRYIPADNGRSGYGIMIGGKSFRVPPQFSGTPENNFVNRLFDGKDKQLTDILSGLLE